MPLTLHAVLPKPVSVSPETPGALFTERRTNVIFQFGEKRDPYFNFKVQLRPIEIGDHLHLNLLSMRLYRGFNVSTLLTFAFLLQHRASPMCYQMRFCKSNHAGRRAPCTMERTSLATHDRIRNALRI